MPGLEGIREDRRQLVVLPNARPVRLTLVGRAEGGDPHGHAEEGGGEDGEDHGQKPQASGAARGEMGAEGKRAENREDQAEPVAQHVGEQVVVGDDVAGPGLEVGIRVSLEVEARPEG